MFKQRIVAQGMVLMQQAEDTTNSKSETPYFVGKLVELYDMAYVTNCFANNSLFHKALKEAFKVFYNKIVSGFSSAELLASYCDNILKNGGSEKLSLMADVQGGCCSGEEMHRGNHNDTGPQLTREQYTQFVELLQQFQTEKDNANQMDFAGGNANFVDLFAEFSRKKVSRRLLFDKSANDDHERLILTKLKQQCGGQFTSKLEGMLTDLTLAKENQNNFQEYLSNNSSPGIDLTVTVLTSGFWPSYKSCDLSLPVEMAKCVQVFNEFYQTKMKHRKLAWIYSLGTCNVNGKFDSNTIELILGTYQAAVLLLQSLSCAKYKILIKEPSNTTVSSSDYFELNSKFTDRMRRIRVPLAPVDERKKSRKVLPDQQLVAVCSEQLSSMFKPDLKAIKKQMEDLITRDYLEREQDNPNLF
ncbi:hypothetical protein H5410_050586, partial [Solanum commersonii]